ncbi:malto-oligosyltrehalose synthase [Sphingomonas sp. KR1UV-12]|uniref:Malto-oligosyltrehalose synthase n=1 Tax=Sphingomonas aurea TaxID=3063994 RepID=A0ABT9EJX3_9SPHN|nr:malto-oligosyltrehalose synthase [Sphingomonas sp. KR1UV-12]MDP1027270.1 malto-oligosyltrehalose synthase [Sphingomonas sp. KR1UV-12]
MTPRATYRLQMHSEFTFADATAIVPYLADLGISHAYLSPITVATKGSTHGYDVVDPTRINPELGGEEGFRALVAALREHGMGTIIDIVPNHMGVAGGENAWWNDVLARGEASEFAGVFDIDFSRPIVLPVLGDPLPKALADGAIAIEGDEVVAYGEHRFPLRPKDHGVGAVEGEDLAALLDRQHYRLAWWRTADDELNWRRFFTVNELAGVRVGQEPVFERTHALFFRLWQEGLIDGVRIDHVDGLTDPATYCRRLRARFDAMSRADGVPAIIWVEKILGAGEPLAADWGIDGTSGYDFMEEVAGLLHDPAGEAPLGEAWAALSGRSADFAPEELQARQDVLAWQFEGQLKACVRAFVALAESDPDNVLTPEMLRRGIERLLWVFPVYRTYGTGDAAPAADAAIRAQARERVAPLVPPGEDFVVDAVLGWLAGEGPGDAALAAEAVRRFQQLSAPVAAKGVEDTAFYRYGRLLSRNDVGFDAGRFAGSTEDFHAAMAARAEEWPRALLATATHDHKRGEDVRARLAVLSEVPELWLEHVARWNGLAADALEGVDPADAYMLYQMLYAAWPVGLETTDAPALRAFAERIVAWQEKALREGKLRSSWEAPQEEYEALCKALVERLLDPAHASGFLDDLTVFRTATAAPARANMLAQVALRLTVPGVPDTYQGTELADLSLVDPDNRTPVDYDARAAALSAGRESKLALIAELLALRRERPALFAVGRYVPVEVKGERADHVLAFLREDGEARLLVAVALRMAAGGEPGWWGDTAVMVDGAERRAVTLFRTRTVAVALL